MIIEKIPSFLLSPSDFFDSFLFDNSGRFIFCKKRKDNAENIVFIIYDILFNTYVELTPHPPNPNIATAFEYECFWEEIRYFLPISIKQALIIVPNGSTEALLLLLHFDLHKKIYEILDYVNILKCQNPEFVRGVETFGLFYLSSIDGEMVDIRERENAFLMLKKFTIQENRIVFGEEKKFNFNAFNDSDYPVDLYLFSEKLWYIRKKPMEAIAVPPPQSRHLYSPVPHDPTENNLQICYFDLKENVPSETLVYEIQIEESQSPLILQWVQDSLVFLQFGTKFDVFNLLNFEWTSEALNSGLDFTNMDANRKWEANRTWIEYHCNTNPRAEWANFSAVHIDNEFVITAINRKSSTLHRIPLKEPLKLSMIAWICALNVGLIHENTNLPPKLPFSRVF